MIHLILPMEMKLNVAVLYGGRSGEHEVSLISAASAFANLDRNRFNVLPIGIDRDGRWYLNSDNQKIIVKPKPGKGSAMPHLVIRGSDAKEVFLEPIWQESGRARLKCGEGYLSEEVDVFMPILHGPLYEDGALQGLLELCNVSYVGAGVLGSSCGMDKDVSKRLLKDHATDIQAVPYCRISLTTWRGQEKENLRRIESEIGLPVFVKPANLGSSVGIHKVKSSDQLAAAIDDALLYDEKVLVEKALKIREIELAVLQEYDGVKEKLSVSEPGEIRPKHEFYSYDAKYIDEFGAELLAPAPLEKAQVERAKSGALEIFKAIECQGLARVDLFLDEKGGQFYFNEINTMPGFTKISMYPRLWGISGIPYGDLLGRLIDSARARHEIRKNFKRQWN